MYLPIILLLASSLLLSLWLTLILFHHRIYRHFPIFFAYNVYATFAIAARFVALYAGTYFYVYWWSELGSLLLAIAAIHEAFYSIFEGFYLLPWFRRCYFGGIAIVLISSIINSLFNRPNQVHPLFAIVLDIAIPINCILAAIFALFYLAAKMLKVSFRQHPFAIVLGFGVTAVGSLIPYVVRSVFGKKMEGFFLYGFVVANYITMLLWLIAFYRQAAFNSPVARADGGRSKPVHPDFKRIFPRQKIRFRACLSVVVELRHRTGTYYF